MRTHVLEQDVVLKRPLGEVFEFFSKAENLEKLTPNSIKFKILSALPIEMKAGALIDYRITLLGVPFPWKTKIDVWEPPSQFVDTQQSGPYLLWRHTHRFSSEGEFTAMSDRVEYAVPGWFLEPLIHRLFVKPQVKQIFEFRTEAVGKLFGLASSEPPRFVK